MLKIVVESRDGVGLVRAEGQMIGPWVNELRHSLRPRPKNPTRFSRGSVN